MIVKFVFVIISQVRITCTTKTLKHVIVGLVFEKFFIRRQKFENNRRQPIYGINSCVKSFPPKFDGQFRLS